LREEIKLSVSLRELLTVSPAPDKKPLFRSGLELGRRIANTKEYPSTEGKWDKNPYAGREHTTISMINQLMRAECSASPELVRILVYLVEQRLEGVDQKYVNIWLKKVKESITNILIERKGSEFYREVVDNGLTRAQRTKDFLFLYSSIAPFSSDFYQLRDVMVPLLGLTSEYPIASARFSFFYASNANIYETWRRMFFDTVGIYNAVDFAPLSFNPESQKIDFAYGIDRTVEQMERLEKEGLLQTFLIPEHVVSVPMVALDPLSDDPAVFIGFAAPEEEVGLKAMPVPEPYLTRWIERVAKPLLKKEVPETVFTSFSDVRDRLVSEAQLAVKLGTVPDYSNLIEGFSKKLPK
jgi:hypothetical protein